MNAVSRHFTRAFVAGLVALLPIGGMIFAVIYMETLIAGEWLTSQPFYFPGLGLILVAVVVYLIGVTVSTFIGRWLWRLVDSLLNELPALGQLYRTLKQILGYGKGHDAMFQRVVLLSSEDKEGEELGLVTNEIEDQGVKKMVVFVPGSPNPTTGRMVLLEPEKTRPVDVEVNEALKALVSIGKLPLLPQSS